MKHLSFGRSRNFCLVDFMPSFGFNSCAKHFILVAFFLCHHYWCSTIIEHDSKHNPIPADLFYSWFSTNKADLWNLLTRNISESTTDMKIMQYLAEGLDINCNLECLRKCLKKMPAFKSSSTAAWKVTGGHEILISASINFALFPNWRNL